jgi:hypothetical protein
MKMTLASCLFVATATVAQANEVCIDPISFTVATACHWLTGQHSQPKIAAWPRNPFAAQARATNRKKWKRQ